MSNEKDKTGNGCACGQSTAPRYLLFINSVKVDETEFEGIAFMKLNTGNMLGANYVCDLVKHIPGDDPITCGYFTYNKDLATWDCGFNVEKRPAPVDKTNLEPPPVCVKGCKWLKEYNGLAVQCNALRSECGHMVSRYRCGWNLKPRMTGGHPLDYAPCVFKR